MQPKPWNVTTFFFSHFLVNYGERELWKIFQRWGRLHEVFISRKLNRWGNRFGFVRFYDVRNVGRLEKELDFIRIGNMKLHVNVPRYMKVNVSEGDNVGKQNPKAKVQQQAQGMIKSVWREKEGGKQKSLGRVKSRNGDEVESAWKGQSFLAQTVEPEWLVDSWVGTMKIYRSMEALRELMMQAGLGSIKTRFLGDKDVLLTRQDGMKLKDIATANSDVMAEIFEFLQPWTADNPRGIKVVWIRCYGLPLNLWTMDCFSHIANNVGTLLEVDEATLEWERLEYARLKVRIQVSDKADLSKRMKINDMVYLVTFIEEVVEIERSFFRGWDATGASFESSSVMESRVNYSIYFEDKHWRPRDGEDYVEDQHNNILQLRGGGRMQSGDRKPIDEVGAETLLFAGEPKFLSQCRGTELTCSTKVATGVPKAKGKEVMCSSDMETGGLSEAAMENKQCFSKKAEGSQRVNVWVEESTDSKLMERNEFNWAANEVASELNYVIPYPIMGPEHACKDIGLKTHNDKKRDTYEDGQKWCCVMDTLKDDYNRVNDVLIHLCQMWRAVSESEGFEMGTVLVGTHSGRQALGPVEAVGGSESDGAQLGSTGT